MGKVLFRQRLQRLYARQLDRMARAGVETNLQRSAVVFAPHQDDETLGCGGALLKKKAAGADVKIVFMTDGSRSHRHLMPESHMRAIRAREALAAARLLGMAEHDVAFLEFRDGDLKRHAQAAIERVTGLIRALRPSEIFIPYHGDRQPDHAATNRIALAALRQCQASVLVYEYPVWFWHHWPWVSLPRGMHPATLKVLHASVMAGFGMKALHDLRCAVYVHDVLAQKRLALHQHQSQMTRLIPGSPWATLHDVSDGEFLARFFQPYEMFHRYHWSS
jgi:LmbE family N-acetylglucosaminyl deacetylase